MLETQTSKPVQSQRKASEILFQMAKNKIRKSISLKNKNNIARLRIFNEQGVQQNEELYTEQNKKSTQPDIYGGQFYLRKTSQTQQMNPQQNSQNFQSSNQNIVQDLSQQDEKEKSNKFLNLITQLKMKKIAKNFIGNLPLRRFQFLKSKQYSLINDKSTDKHLEKNQLTIDEQKKKTKNKTLEKLKKFIPVFQPQNKYKLSWDMLQIIGIITFMFTIPIHLSNNILLEELISIYFLQAMVIILSLDILVNFNTGFFEKGELITSRARIAKNYIRNMLFVDVLSIGPLITYFLKHINSVSITSFFLLFFFFKIRCFTKIFRKLEEVIRMQYVALNLLQLFKLLSNILFFTHIFSCIWIYTGKNTGDSTNNWIALIKIQDEKWYIIYLKAYYYVTVTMVTVGYGDIIPANYYEIIIAIIIMLISCGIFAYALNQIGIIFEELQSQSRQSQKYFMVLNNYLEQRNISFSLQYQIREYLDYYWKESKQNKGQLEQQILSQLSETLKQNLLIEANKIILKDSPIFNYNFTDKLLQKTLPLIQEMHCTPEQIIFSQNQVENHDIYFIEKGKIELFTILNQKKRNNSGFHKSLKILEKGQSFGEQSFFTGTERKISARSLDFTKLLYIRRQDFIDLLKEFPQDNESFCMIKDLVNSGQYEKIGLKCYCCDNSSKHSYFQCPYIHYIPDKYKIIKMEYYTHQSRLKKERRKQFKERALNELSRNTHKIQDFIEKNQEFLAQQSLENSQDDYCIQEYSDENCSSQDQDYNNSIKSGQSSQLISESDESVEKENLENMQRKESQRSIVSKKGNISHFEAQEQPIQFSNIDQNNQDDQIPYMQIPNLNKNQFSDDRSQNSFKKPPLQKESQFKSESKKGGTLINFQKLKYNKPNQQITNGTLEPYQEIDSPMSQYRLSKNFQFSQFKRKKKVNCPEQNQIPLSLHYENSVISSNNEMKSTPTLRKKISQQNKNNQIHSNSPKLQHKISSIRKQDKPSNYFDNQKPFTLEKIISHSFHNQSKQLDYDQYPGPDSSPQWSHKALNKIYNQSISRKESFKHAQSTPSYRNNSSNTLLFRKTYNSEQNNMSLLNGFKIKESLEDFDRLKIFSVYFIKFNFDNVIKHSNSIVMKNIKNIVKSKTVTIARRLTQQSTNLLHNQLIHSPLKQNSSTFIFESSQKPKQSQQSSNVNILKSCDYLDDDLGIIDKQKQSYNSSFLQNMNYKKYNRGTNQQKQSQNIISINPQFRRKSLMVKSRSFLDYAIKKYSASQDFNQNDNQENTSPYPKLLKLSPNIDTKKFNWQKNLNLNKRRSSIDSDLKSIKSVQEIGSQVELEDQTDQIDSTNIINIRSSNSRSNDLQQNLRRGSLPYSKVISLNLIKQTYRSSSESSSSESSPKQKNQLSQLSVSSISESQIGKKTNKEDDEYKSVQDDFNNQLNYQKEQLFIQMQEKMSEENDKNKL